MERSFVEVKAGGKGHPADCIARHRVAIIIPFRDRPQHLQTLLYNLHPILLRQQIDYQIFVIEQEGESLRRVKPITRLLRLAGLYRNHGNRLEIIARPINQHWFRKCSCNRGHFIRNYVVNDSTAIVTITQSWRAISKRSRVHANSKAPRDLQVQRQLNRTRKWNAARDHLLIIA